MTGNIHRARLSGTTLVLGGGGISGIAWMTGLLTGLAECGVDLRGAERIIGTSAGATLGAQLGSGLSLEQLFARQVHPAQHAREVAPSLEQVLALQKAFERLSAVADLVTRCKEFGAIALASETISQAERREVIAGRLPSLEWPSQPLSIVAVDALSGELVLLDARGNASLVDAVAASCALPGVWPYVSISGRPHIDGGVRTTDNADLAAGANTAILVSPMGGLQQGKQPSSLSRESAELAAAGTTVIRIEPESGARLAMGSNPLDPSCRPAAAEAGRRQGQREAPRLIGELAHR